MLRQDDDANKWLSLAVVMVVCVQVVGACLALGCNFQWRGSARARERASTVSIPWGPATCLPYLDLGQLDRMSRHRLICGPPCILTITMPYTQRCTTPQVLATYSLARTKDRQVPVAWVAPVPSVCGTCYRGTITAGPVTVALCPSSPKTRLPARHQTTTLPTIRITSHAQPHGNMSQERKRSTSRTRVSRPTTPLRPSSRSSFRDSAKASSQAPFPLDAFEPQFGELSDAMADLEANLMHFQLMHESLARFSESFASFLYGLNMNAFCVDYPEVR